MVVVGFFVCLFKGVFIGQCSRLKFLSFLFLVCRFSDTALTLYSKDRGHSVRQAVGLFLLFRLLL